MIGNWQILASLTLFRVLSQLIHVVEYLVESSQVNNVLLKFVGCICQLMDISSEFLSSISKL